MRKIFYFLALAGLFGCTDIVDVAENTIEYQVCADYYDYTGDRQKESTYRSLSRKEMYNNRDLGGDISSDDERDIAEIQQKFRDMNQDEMKSWSMFHCWPSFH